MRGSQRMGLPMTAPAAQPATTLPAAPGPTGIGGRLGAAIRAVRTDQLPVVALAICFALVLIGLFGNLITPYAVDAVDFKATLAPPFWLEGGTLAHPLGTDQLGRDLLTRLIIGARISLITAGAAVLIGGTLGLSLGLTAGYLGGVTDVVIMRLTDAFLALPFILMALALVAALGTGLGNIVLVMVLTNWARYARLVRAEVQSVKQRDFVTLARIAGLHPIAIALRHVLPNVLGSVFVLAILDIGRAIILESSLSFLGLGMQPPDVSWGLILADGRAFMDFAWWLTVFPGIAIVVAVMSFNAAGEWLKTYWDPRGFA